MHLSDLWPKLDREQRDALAESVGSKAIYLWQVSVGRRHPSPALCRRLVAADRRLTLRKLRPDIWGSGEPIAPANRGRKARTR